MKSKTYKVSFEIEGNMIRSGTSLSKYCLRKLLNLNFNNAEQVSEDSDTKIKRLKITSLKEKTK